MASTNGRTRVEEAEEMRLLGEMGPLTLNLAPESRDWENLERYMAGGASEDIASLSTRSLPQLVMKGAQAVARGIMQAVTVDWRILTQMEFSEQVTAMDGDLWQAIVVPMSVGLTDYRVQHPDEGIQSEFEELFEYLQMQDILEQMWLSTEIYGNTYPLEFWSGDMLEGVSFLNPKYVVVQPTVYASQRPIFFAPPADVGEALEKDNLFVSTTAMAVDTNERPTGVFPISQENIYHIHQFKLPHQIYALPPLARAARAISTRMMLEEMIRSTIEGVKNQIILYSLENPKPGERALLETKLRATRSARIQHLVWTNNLEIDQIMPKAIDPLLAHETWWRLTLDVFRKMGINIRMLSGEVAGSGSPGRDFEVDVQLYLERLKPLRRRVVSWMRRIATRYAKLQGIEKVPDVGLRDIDIAVQAKIKNKLQLLMQYGFPSIETIMEESGLSFDVEVSRRRNEWDAGLLEIFQPYTGFKQTATDATGNTSTTKSPLSPGRPVGKSDNNGKGDNEPT